MIICVVMILALLLFRLQFAGRGFHADFIGRDAIQPVKGVFILLIIVSHFIQYVKLDGPLDAYYMSMRTLFVQHRYLYLAAVAALTFPLSYVFDKTVPYLWDKILPFCHDRSN